MIGDDRMNGTSPTGNGDDGAVEMGLVAQAASELVRGADALLVQENLYSAAALIRQLVEIEYLAWSFAERPDIAGDWLRSDREARRRYWQPAKLRGASGGRFDAAEYWAHCDIGGHPTPSGLRALLGSALDQAVMTEIQWFELCHHTVRVWHLLLAAATIHDVLLDDLRSHALPVIELWRSSDGLVRLADQ